MMIKMLSKNVMHHFYRQRSMHMYLLDHNMIQKNEEYAVIKRLFWNYNEINQRFLNGRYHCYFLLEITQYCHNIWLKSVNILTPQITTFIPLTRWGEMIVNLSYKKCENGKNFTVHLNHI